MNGRAGVGRPVRRFAALPLLATALAALLLSGCIGSTYDYVSHHNSDGTNLYFKVPDNWTVFGAKQIVEAANGPLSQTQINQIEAGQWVTAFSAAPRATAPKQLVNQSALYPNGVVFAHQLSESDRDALSLASMRSYLLGSDPLAASTSSPFNVLSYTETTSPGGVRESRLVTDVDGSNGAVSTFGQVIAVDPQTNWIYGIGIACKASCWGTNQGLIDEVLSSWNVKEIKS